MTVPNAGAVWQGSGYVSDPRPRTVLRPRMQRCVRLPDLLLDALTSQGKHLPPGIILRALLAG